MNGQATHILGNAADLAHGGLSWLRQILRSAGRRPQIVIWQFAILRSFAPVFVLFRSSGRVCSGAAAGKFLADLADDVVATGGH